MNWQTWVIGLMGVALILIALTPHYRKLTTRQITAILVGIGLVVWALAGLTEFSAGGFSIKRTADRAYLTADAAKKQVNEIHAQIATLAKLDADQLRKLEARVINLENQKGPPKAEVKKARAAYDAAARRADAIRRSLAKSSHGDEFNGPPANPGTDLGPCGPGCEIPPDKDTNLAPCCQSYNLKPDLGNDDCCEADKARKSTAPISPKVAPTKPKS